MTIIHRPAAGKPAAVHRPGALMPLASEFLVVHPMRCARARNRNVTCSKCADACARGALTVLEGALNVDAAACDGCGGCAMACTTGALVVDCPSRADLMASCLDALGMDGSRIIALVAPGCVVPDDKTTHPQVEVRLERIDAGLLMGLAAHGCVHVELRGTVSRACGRMLCSCVEACRVVLDALASPMTIGMGGVVVVDELLGCVGECPVGCGLDGCEPDGCGPAAQAGCEVAGLPHRLMSVGASGVLPAYLPDARADLLDAIAVLALASEDPEPDRPVPAPWWASLEVDASKCVGCHACVVFCPTGACRAIDDGDDYGVWHRPADCTRCGSCVDTCRMGAIRLVDAVTIDDLVHGRAHRHLMPRPAYRKGGVDSMAQCMRELLGMPEVWDR